MKLKRFFILFSVAILLVVSSCKKEEAPKEDATRDPQKDRLIREYNLDVNKQQAEYRFPCDTLSLIEYVLESYPAGSYLIKFDRTTIYNIPKPAVIYYKDGRNYIFALIATSKPEERLIEPTNITGFESSYINLDSTKLGTAFFFLTLFECRDQSFDKIWESEVPIHGGFNKMTIKTWKPKNIQYIELNFEDGIISGHRNYNFFLVDGLLQPPHLIETYEGIVHKRRMANVNNDKFPDYYEYRFKDSTYIRPYDSIPFYWSEKKQLYISDRNPGWFRKY